MPEEKIPPKPIADTDLGVIDTSGLTRPVSVRRERCYLDAFWRRGRLRCVPRCVSADTTHQTGRHDRVNELESVASAAPVLHRILARVGQSEQAAAVDVDARKIEDATPGAGRMHVLDDEVLAVG